MRAEVRSVNDELNDLMREIAGQQDFSLLGEWEWWSLYALWTGGESMRRHAALARRTYLDAVTDDPEMAR